MIRRIIRKIKVFVANRNWENKRNYLIAQGASIGQGTRLNCGIEAFGSEPYLIRVGRDCLFAKNVNFVTHDGG